MNILKEVPMIVDWPATWSKILIFLSCHWRFWLQEGSKFVTGKADIPFTTNIYMQRGEAKHDLYERAARAMSGGRSFTTSMTENPLWNPRIGELIQGLLAVYKHVWIEEKIGIDSTWQAWTLGKYWEPDKVAFNNKKMLLRTKMDLSLFDRSPFDNPTHAVIVDWKSGKARMPEVMGQLALYALVAFCKWPTLERIDCVYVFVDHNIKYTNTYLKSMSGDLKEYFASQITTIQQYLQAAQTKIPAGDCTPGNCYFCGATKEQCNEKT